MIHSFLRSDQVYGPLGLFDSCLQLRILAWSKMISDVLFKWILQNQITFLGIISFARNVKKIELSLWSLVCQRLWSFVDWFWSLLKRATIFKVAESLAKSGLNPKPTQNKSHNLWHTFCSFLPVSLANEDIVRIFSSKESVVIQNLHGSHPVNDIHLFRKTTWNEGLTVSSLIEPYDTKY